MSTPMRPPGVYGKRAPKRHPAIELGPLLTGVVPAHPVAVDYLNSHPGWRMLGNGPDPQVSAGFAGAGDCVAVTGADFRRLVTAVLGDRETYPSLDWVWQVYRTQNPGFDPLGDPNVNGPGSAADGGMDIQTLLEYLHTTGTPDGVKVVAFAKVDYTRPAEVKAAIGIFGGVWTGTAVLDINEAQFASGDPWDWDPAGTEVGLHSVLTGGYGAEPGGGDPALGGDEKFVTWAQETSFTDAFWAHLIDECWVVVWPEHLGSRAFQEGIDQQALAQAYQQVTGRTPPWQVPPAPTPTPTPPVPVPAPHADDAADQAFAAVLLAQNEHGQTWMAQRHPGYIDRVAAAAAAWYEARFVTPPPAAPPQ